MKSCLARHKALISIVTAGLIITKTVAAESTENAISDEELRSIRTVSQSILKVRGQHRSVIERESQSQRIELDNIKAILEEAYVLVSTPILNPSDIQTQGKTVRTAGSARSNSLANNRKTQVDSMLDAAINKLETERGRSQAGFERSSDRTSSKAKQTSRVRDKLRELRDQLTALKEKSPDIQKTELRQMLAHFRVQKLAESERKEQPTLTTRRVHKKRRSQQ